MAGIWHIHPPTVDTIYNNFSDKLIWTENDTLYHHGMTEELKPNST